MTHMTKEMSTNIHAWDTIEEQILSREHSNEGRCKTQFNGKIVTELQVPYETNFQANLQYFNIHPPW